MDERGTQTWIIFNRRSLKFYFIDPKSTDG